MSFVYELPEVVVLHGVAYDDPCGEGGYDPHDNIENDSPKEAQTPQVESRHEGEKRSHKHDVGDTHMTAYALLLAQCGLVSLVMGKDVVGVLAPLAFSVKHRPYVR